MWWLLLSALASEVVVFGDSWAEGGGDELADVLAAHGRRDLAVENLGVGGTTAEYWNTTAPTALSDAVSANADAQIVWLSILGNDTFGYYAASQGASASARNEEELRALVGGLVAEHPDIVVLMLGYDYVNFEQSAECILTAAIYFPELVASGNFSTLAVNRIFEADVGEVVARVALDFPQLHHVPVWGTLQDAGGVVGAPVDWLPSPSSLMSDCIHPTSEGYRLVHEALWDGAFALPEPTAGLEVPEKVCVDDASFRLRSTSADASAWRWNIDGEQIGTDEHLTPPTPAPGLHTARLWVRNGAWTDSIEAPFEVVDHPTAAITPGSPVVCLGGSITLTAVGEGTPGWSSSGGSLGAERSITLTPQGDQLVSINLSTAPDCDKVVSAQVTVLTGGDCAGDSAPPADTEIPEAIVDPGCGGCRSGGAPGRWVWLILTVGLFRRRRAKPIG